MKQRASDLIDKHVIADIISTGQNQEEFIIWLIASIKSQWNSYGYGMQ